MRRRIGLITVSMMALIASVSAQCALCRATVESASDSGLANGLQAGIYLLLLVPYLLGGWIFYRWFRSYR